MTVLVGENGSGKSTIVEALAIAFGLSSEGGSRGHTHRTRPTESSLQEHLQLVRGAGGARAGFFLRAETMHGFYTYLEEHGGRRPAKLFHEMSHGESFLEVAGRPLPPARPVRARRARVGLVLRRLPRAGRSPAPDRVVGAGAGRRRHPLPVVAALPGADILEVGEWGLRRSTWADLGLVDHWTRFLRDPQSYLRHVIDA